jgi:Ca2+-binding RTX toxin-like protein
MAIVKGGAFSLDLTGNGDDTFEDLADGTIVSKSSTLVKITGGGGDVDYYFGGTGFGGFSQEGIPTTGTITSFVEKIHGTNTTGVSITGTSIPVSVLVDAIMHSNVKTFIAALLSKDDTITGSAHADVLVGYAGDDVIHGGKGHDLLDGGKGNDRLDGGADSDHLIGLAGKDTFAYGAASDSTSKKFDTITGADFDKADKFDFTFKVTGIDHAITTGKLNDAKFDANLASAVNTDVLQSHHALLFTASAGDHKGQVFLVVDANGHAGYQGGEDFVIRLDSATHLGSLNLADFT